MKNLDKLTDEEVQRLIEDSGNEFEVDSDSEEDEIEDFERNKQATPEIENPEQYTLDNDLENVDPNLTNSNSGITTGIIADWKKS